MLISWIRIPPGAWIFVCCECRVLSGRGLCDELITRPEESYRLWCVVVCDLETSRIGAPYIYDISSLRVNDLTLILLKWRKWWTPNNASKWQMGFNSAFKGLMTSINHEHEYIIVHSLRHYADNTGICTSIKSSSFTQRQIKYWDFSRRWITTCQKTYTFSVVKTFCIVCTTLHYLQVTQE